jgi:hypothetical protein
MTVVKSGMTRKELTEALVDAFSPKVESRALVDVTEQKLHATMTVKYPRVFIVNMGEHGTVLVRDDEIPT